MFETRLFKKKSVIILADSMQFYALSVLMVSAISFLLVIAVSEGSIRGDKRKGWVCSHTMHGTITYRHANSNRFIEFGNLKECPRYMESPPDFNSIFQDGLESQPHGCCFYNNFGLADSRVIFTPRGDCSFEFHYKGGSNAARYNDPDTCSSLLKMSLEMVFAIVDGK